MIEVLIRLLPQMLVNGLTIGAFPIINLVSTVTASPTVTVNAGATMNVVNSNIFPSFDLLMFIGP